MRVSCEFSEKKKLNSNLRKHTHTHTQIFLCSKPHTSSLISTLGANHNDFTQNMQLTAAQL